MNESGKRRLNLSWGAATDQGRVRTTNQDAMHTDSGLFAVADGMGGHQGGEVAANIAVRTLSAAEHDSLENFESAFVEANRVVHQTALTKPNLHGMGTTLTAIAVLGATDSRHFAIANVGDSRIYRFNGAEFEQLTLDHSYVAELVRREEITEADAAAHPYRNMLTRAIGVHSEVQVDSWRLTPKEGDRFILCSDGLTNELSDMELIKHLIQNPLASNAAKALVRAANIHGGRDNTTVVVINVNIENIETNESDEAPQINEKQSNSLIPDNKQTRLISKLFLRLKRTKGLDPSDVNNSEEI